MTEEKDERLLVLEARQGSQEAFEQLVKLHEKRIYNLALRMAGNPEDAGELAQEAFLSAWRGLPAFKMECSFGTWLYRLASNACIDFLRKEKRRRVVSMTAVSEEDEEYQTEYPDLRYSPETELERREILDEIQRGLDSLSVEHRQILVMRELDSMTYAEIAEVLKLEEGTVKSRISRARVQLRGFLVSTGNFHPRVSSKEAEGGELHERV
ncbi:RNA polymerase sigma factor [Papillibacter cinnamivorans]|uniref:RNA polymerase sigma-70 factor, ECF subfamily n=1 Tax=Papillibacter cinnamivorans DSM 12816 TaxID=1122930 RepID=A0A1W2BJV3_9FIRM|nr:sigma-70 family RNA polymerase sigma factor [Papillibacter cinnamivorans]SMC73163.1 RNA polymerase sigma-70 factor, ECF subfamily [Papillibacter cinnamivorans DSM 12816]